MNGGIVLKDKKDAERIPANFTITAVSEAVAGLNSGSFPKKLLIPFPRCPIVNGRQLFDSEQPPIAR